MKFVPTIFWQILVQNRERTNFLPNKFCGLRIRIRSDPNLFAGSGSRSFPPDPDPRSGSFPSYIKLYNTIICKLSYFKFSNLMTGEHFSTTKVSKCGHFRWYHTVPTYFLIFFVTNHAKNMRDRKNVLFFKARSGSGFRILIFRIRIRPKMDRIRNLFEVYF